MNFIFRIVLSLVLLSFCFSCTNNKKQVNLDNSLIKTSYTDKELFLDIAYNPKISKDKNLFGGIIPYEEVWPLGGKVAATFTTNKKIGIQDQVLEKGTYTLHIIPYESQWTIIFNSNKKSWWSKLLNSEERDPKFDVMKVNVIAEEKSDFVDKLSIEFIYHVNIQIRWGHTEVIVPIVYGFA